MDIFITEFKRQITIEKFIKYIGISIVMALLWSWFIIGGARSGFLGKDSYEGIKGLEAIETATKDQNIYGGKMTEDRFQLGGKVFKSSIKEVDDDSDEIVINDELLQLKVYVDILISQDYKLRKIFGEDQLDNFQELPSDFGYEFYDKENIYYKKLINNSMKNQAEKDLAHKIWNDVEKPYTYYGGFGVWRDGIEHIQLMSFVLLVMVAFFTSGIIAKDKETSLDEIISTTKEGRRKLLVPKIILPIIMGTLIYTVGIGLYISILKFLLPQNALETSSQLWSTSILPYSLGYVMRKMISFGLIGTITVSIFTTFVSSKMKKTSMVMSITTLILMSSFLLSVQMDLNNPILKWINLFLPSSLVFSFFKFTLVPVESVLGKAILSFDLNLITTILILMISLITTSWNYTRR